MYIHYTSYDQNFASSKFIFNPYYFIGAKCDVESESVSPNKEDWQKLLQKSDKYESNVRNRFCINDSIHGHIQVF